MASADCRAKVCNATCRQKAADASLANALNAQNPHDRTILASQAVPATYSLPMGRIASIEHLRIVAAVGIVWFHTETSPYRDIGYAGLPIFLLIFFSLITRDFGTTIGHFLQRRWDRLLKPWLFWSGVYGACYLVKAMFTMNPTDLRGMFTLGTLFTGTSIHLWYLPYAFVSGLLVFAMNRRMRETNHVVTVITATITGMLTLAVCTVALTGQHMAQPLPQWEFGLASIPLGLAIGRCLMIPSQNLRRTLLAGIGLAVLVESQILQAAHAGGTAIPYGIGVPLVCVAYCVEIKGNILVATLAPLTFGVYLVHPLVIYGLRHSLPLTGHPVLFVASVACLSTLVTLVLMRTPVKRFL